jgi:hypothetical protein
MIYFTKAGTISGPLKMLIAGLFFSVLFFPGQAQTLADTSLYYPGIRLIRNASTDTEYQHAAAYFINSAAAQKQWLLYYYAGLSFIHASIKAKENRDKDLLIDKAQPMISKAFQLKPGEPELHVLQAFLYQARIQVNPEMRGLSYSGKAETSLKKAVSADPENPRAWFLWGQNVYNTPSLFGGGAEKALPMFMKAKEGFRSFRPALPFMPVWGEPENQQMIAACLKEK